MLLATRVPTNNHLCSEGGQYFYAKRIELEDLTAKNSTRVASFCFVFLRASPKVSNISFLKMKFQCF
jgi:hypothetical protein